MIDPRVLRTLTFHPLPVDRGHVLRAAHAPAPPGAPPRATVVLLPGRSEYIEKYAELICDLQARDLEIYALDWRGQGGSTRTARDPGKGHIDSYQTYLSDLHTFLRRLVLPNTPGPVVLLAHSMGAHLALRYLAEAPPDAIQGAVLSAPMIGVAADWWTLRALDAVATNLTRLGHAERWISGARSIAEEAPFEANQLTHDRDRYEASLTFLRQHPTLWIGGFTAGWGAATLTSIRALHRRPTLQRVRHPVTLISPLADTRVDPQATRHASHWLPNARLVEIDGARHEILFEIDPYRQQALAALDEHLRLTPPAP